MSLFYKCTNQLCNTFQLLVTLLLISSCSSHGIIIFYAFVLINHSFYHFLLDFSQSKPKKISVSFVAQQNSNNKPDFRSNLICSQEKETLQLEINFVPNKYTAVNNRNGRFREKLPFDSATVRLNLVYDKTVPRYRVFKTNKNKAGTPITKNINEKVHYKRESCHPKQFKAIEEFYGSIEVNGQLDNSTFVRAIVEFVDCDRVFLFAFIRHGNTLYQIRPILHNLALPANQIKPNLEDDSPFAHEFFTIVDNLDSDMFTSNSMAIKNAIKFNLNFVKMKRYGRLTGNWYERIRPNIEDGLCRK